VSARAQNRALALAGAVALALVVLGCLPWERAGTPWRPHAPEREQLARAHWDDDLIARGREFRSNGYELFFLRRGARGLAIVIALALGAHLLLRRLPLRARSGRPRSRWSRASSCWT
jgi:hypothetical protein